MGNIVVFKFTEVERNPELDKDFFDFKIPEGTDIIRESNVGEF